MARCNNNVSASSMTGTASGMSVASATVRATSGTSQSAASAVF